MDEIVRAKDYPSPAERLFWDRAMDVAGPVNEWDLASEIRITVMVRLATLLAKWAA